MVMGWWWGGFQERWRVPCPAETPSASVPFLVPSRLLGKPGSSPFLTLLPLPYTEATFWEEVAGNRDWPPRFLADSD